MNGQNILLAKLALGGTAAMAALLLCGFSSALDRMAERRFFWSTYGFLALSHIGLFVLVFGVFRIHPESDVLLYYQQGKAAMNGLLPYRDFASSYAPVFPYITGYVLRIYDSPLALVFLSIVLELIAFPLWFSICCRAFDERTTRFASLLYVTSVIPWVNTVLAGQNQVWLMFLLGIAIAMLMANRAFVSGLGLGIGLAGLKFLALLFAPLLVVAARNRVRWIAGMALLPILVYGFFWHKGVNILAPLVAEGSMRTAGNLPFLIRFAWPAAPDRLFDVFTLVALAIVFFALLPQLVRGSPVALIAGSAAVLLVLLIFSKKAYSNYLMIAFFPICAVVAAHGLERRWIAAAAFGLFGVAASIEPSLWFRWLQQGELRDAISGGLGVIRTLAFLLCEFALLASYVWCLAAAIRLARSTACKAR